jgi:hypothetical protein
VLPTISVPTLVVARPNAVISHRQSRYVADHIPGAKSVELGQASRDLDILDPVEEFVTGRLAEVAVDRVLTTVLFTDIVDSTAWAASIGDRAWRYRLDVGRRELARSVRIGPFSALLGRPSVGDGNSSDWLVLTPARLKKRPRVATGGASTPEGPGEIGLGPREAQPDLLPAHSAVQPQEQGKGRPVDYGVVLLACDRLLPRCAPRPQKYANST